MKTSAALRSAVAGSLFLAASLAFSQDGGFYLSAATMVTIPGPYDFAIGAMTDQDDDFTATSKGTASFDIGVFGVRIAGGYRIFAFRPEVELSYRQISLDDIEYSSFSRDGVELPDADLQTLNDRIKVRAGHLVLLGAMANFWGDINTGTPVTPFLGVGAGLGQVVLDDPARRELSDDSADRESPESSASTFAFQVGAGLGFDLGAGVSLSLGYRLLGTTEASLAWNVEDSNTDDILKADILLHSIELAITAQF